MMNKGILCKIFIIPLLLIPLVCPFHISADTYITTSNIVACHVESYERDTGSSTIYFNHVKCFFDANYEGYADFRIQYDIAGNTYTTSKLVVASGTSVEFQVDTSPGNINTGSLVTVLSISNNHMIYKSDSLIEISNMYSFPFESFLPVNYVYSQGFTIDSLFRTDKYIYPVFISDTNGYVYRLRQSSPIRVIIWSTASIYNIATFNNYFSYLGTASNFKQLNAVQGQYLFSVDISGEYSNFLDLKWKVANIKFIPIYINYADYSYVSTDFALQFGLKNDLLTNLDTIANGTNSSSSASSSLETVSDDISSSSDDLIQSENSFNNSMNSNLQQIDTNINIGNLGSKFLASADWVRMQFNTLTNGTPFGSVLSFSLLLGLALVLVGRIRK